MDYAGQVESSLDDLAYITMTSGSTGKPKAIRNAHRAATIDFVCRCDMYPYETGTTGDTANPPGNQVEREGVNMFFAWECLRPLLRGATAVVIPGTQSHSKRVRHYVNVHGPPWPQLFMFASPATLHQHTWSCCVVLCSCDFCVYMPLVVLLSRRVAFGPTCILAVYWAEPPQPCDGVSHLDEESP